jgi:hypothetical protein
MASDARDRQRDPGDKPLLRELKIKLDLYYQRNTNKQHGGGCQRRLARRARSVHPSCRMRRRRGALVARDTRAQLTTLAAPSPADQVRIGIELTMHASVYRC